MALEQQIQTLQHMIDESKKLVFFEASWSR